MLATAEPDTDLDYDPTERRPVITLIKDPTRAARDRWYWVEDPTRTETAQERHARLLADNRLVDMYGVATIIGRKHPTVKGIRYADDAQRTILRNARIQLDPKRAARYMALELRQLQHPVTHPQYDRTQREMDELDNRIDELAGRSRDPQTQQVLFQFREAREKVLLAIPIARDVQGQSPLWYVSDWIYWRRRRGMNDIWGDNLETRGRPKGSKTTTR